MEASTIHDYSDRELIFEFKKRIDNESIKIDISPNGVIDFIASENPPKEQTYFIVDIEKTEAMIRKTLSEDSERLKSIRNADEWTDFIMRSISVY